MRPRRGWPAPSHEVGQRYQEKKEPKGPQGVEGGRERAVAMTEKRGMEGVDKMARQKNRK